MKLYTIYVRRDVALKGGALEAEVYDLVLSGGSVKYDTYYNCYYVEPQFISPELEAKIEATEFAELFYHEVLPEGDMQGYYVKVVDLAQELDVSLPQSTVESEEGVVRQLTYQEVEDKPTVSTQPRVDGAYYFSATAQCGFRPLTWSEYNAVTVELIHSSNLPAFPDVEN